MAVDDPQFNSYREASQLPARYSRLVRRQDYRQLENESVEVGDIRPMEGGRDAVAAALKRYANKFMAIPQDSRM